MNPTEPIEFWYAGLPESQLRHRSFRSKSGFIGQYDDPKSKAWKDALKTFIRIWLNQNRPGFVPWFDTAIDLRLEVIFPIPPSVNLKRRPYPIVVPDWDNLGKIVGDALNGVLWMDDKIICDGYVRKRYGAVPGLHFYARPLPVGIVDTPIEQIEWEFAK